MGYPDDVHEAALRELDPKKAELLWVDIETTGLDPRSDAILEVGLIATTKDLEEVDHRSEVFWATNGELRRMSEKVRRMHGESGLLDEVARVDELNSEGEARLVKFAFGLFGAGLPPMCGSSVHFDRSFLAHSMPRLLSAFHYRNLDVSSLKCCARLWRPGVVVEREEAAKPHRAIQDLRLSIAELKHYRAELFK